MRPRSLCNRRRQLFLLIFVVISIFVIRNEILVQFSQNAFSVFQKFEVTCNTDMNGIHLNEVFYGCNDFHEIDSALFLSKRPNKSTKVILLYTTLFGQPRWTGLDDNEITTHFYDVNCPVQNCEITYDKAKLKGADAVVFHGVDLHWNPESRPQQLLTISRDIRPSWQRWVFFMHEPPTKNERDYHMYNWIFNWTASYRRKSDIFVPYYHYEKIDINEKESIGRSYAYEVKGNENYHLNFAREKTGVVVWAVSNCGLIREQFVLELQKHVDITVYGKCSHRFRKPGYGCIHRTNECFETLSKYKFYLAFENSFCEDYVTEKYWENSIKLNIVPVVLGANYDSDLVIPGSYIDADKFSSIEELAKYLNYLNKNDTAYNEYFEWKKFYRMVSFDPVCAFCQKLHDELLTGRVYHNIGRFWSVAEQCQPFTEKENKLENLIQQSRAMTAKKRRTKAKTAIIKLS